MLDVRREDEVCLLDRCTSEALAPAHNYQEVRELTKGYEWAGERLSRALTLLRARRHVVGTPSATAVAAAGAREQPPASRFDAQRSAEREVRRQTTIGLAAAGTFVVITVGGFCLALGIAVGQRIAPAGMLRLVQDSGGSGV